MRSPCTGRHERCLAVGGDLVWIYTMVREHEVHRFTAWPNGFGFAARVTAPGQLGLNDAGDEG